MGRSLATVHGAAVLIDFNNENLALPLTADVYNVIPAQTGTGVMSELANGGSGGGTGLSASSLVDTTGAATQSSLLCFPRW